MTTAIAITVGTNIPDTLINSYGIEHKTPPVAVDNFKALSGNGLTATIGSDTLYAHISKLFYCIGAVALYRVGYCYHTEHTVVFAEKQGSLAFA